MKKMVLLFVALMTLASASAQTEGKEEKKDNKRGDRTEWMVKELGLDEAQAAKVKELNAKYPELQHRGRGHHGRGQRNFQEPKVDGTSGATAQTNERPQRPSREEMEKRRAERQEKMAAYNNELKQILTEDQYKAYEQKQEEMRKNGRRPGRRNQ